MPATPMSDAEVGNALDGSPLWAGDSRAITRTVTAPTFAAAIELVVAVAGHAEQVDHHPDIDIRWRAVTFTLSTHSAGGVTAKDLAMAATIDRLADGG